MTTTSTTPSLAARAYADMTKALDESQTGLWQGMPDLSRAIVKGSMKSLGSSLRAHAVSKGSVARPSWHMQHADAATRLLILAMRERAELLAMLESARVERS